MSPAAVDFRSSVSSPQPKSSFPHSSNISSQTSSPHSPLKFSALSSADTVGLPCFNYIMDGGFNCASFSPAVSRRSSVSYGTGRSKPRLVKVRRQLPRTVNLESDSGDNPFRFVSDHVNDDRTSGTSTGRFVGSLQNSISKNPFISTFPASDKVSRDVAYSGENGDGFVFGRERSNLEKRGSSQSGRGPGLETNKDVKAGTNLKPESSATVAVNTNVSFVNTDLANGQTCEREREAGNTENGEVKLGNGSEYWNYASTSFSFCADVNYVEVCLDLRRTESSENMSKLCDLGNAGSVLDVNGSESAVHLGSKKIESVPSMGNLGLNDACKMGAGVEKSSEKFENVGFSAGAVQNGLASSSDYENEKSTLNVGTSRLDELTKMDMGIEVEFRNNEPISFGCGSSEDYSKIQNEQQNIVCGEETSNPDAKRNVKVDCTREFHCMRNDFVFSSSSKHDSCFGEPLFSGLPDEISKFKSEAYNGISKPQNEVVSDSRNLSDEKGDLNLNLKFEVSGCSAACASNGGSLYTLSDKMKQLDIGDAGGLHASQGLKDLNIKSHDKTTNLFVFASNRPSINQSDFSKPGILTDNTDGVGCNTNVRRGSIFENSSMPVGVSSETPCSPLYTPQRGNEESRDPRQILDSRLNDGTKSNGAAAPHIFSLSDLEFRQDDNNFGLSFKDRVGKNNGSTDELGAPFGDFTGTRWNPPCFKANNLSPSNTTSEFSSKNTILRSRRSKKRREKFQKSASVEQGHAQNFGLMESCIQGNLDSPGSPMDFSPYQETIADDQCSRDDSVTSIKNQHLENKDAPTGAHANPVHLAPTITEPEQDGQCNAFKSSTDCGFGKGIGGEKNRGPNQGGSSYHFEEVFSTDGPIKDSVSVAEAAKFNSIVDEGSCNFDANAGSAEVNGGFSSNTERQFCFTSSLQDTLTQSYTFCASSLTPCSISASKRKFRKKNRMRTGCDSFVITPRPEVAFTSSSPQLSPLAGEALHLDKGHGKKGELLSSQSNTGNQSATDREESKQKSTFPSTETVEACEKWRLRGNQAYQGGDFSKAEEFYSRGIAFAAQCKTSEDCLNSRLLLHSNRAAARMSLGRIREALDDCFLAAAIDPNFLKVKIRAANFHMLLGEIEDATRYYKECLTLTADVCLDRRLVIEASYGLQKAQKIADCVSQSAELLQRKTFDAATSALDLVSAALSQCLYSEKLLEMKGEALCMLRKYEETIQLCEDSLKFAEKNFPKVDVSSQFASLNGLDSLKGSSVRLWRQRLTCKCYYNLGKLEKALDLLQKEEKEGPIKAGSGSSNLDSLDLLAITIRELLQHKNAGNEAFQSGKNIEALDHYTAALSRTIESRPFAAICLCNRAAAYQALGQITDAIADSSLAIALDGNYSKAVSRRATLYEVIRDYRQAACDLHRLISILEKQSMEKEKRAGGSNSFLKDIRQAKRRLSSMDELSKKEIPLDLYFILGVKPSDSASEIKKAYKKAALRHHPDKACQFLARTERGDDVQLWKEIAEEVHKEADRLFKMIGEAYAVLSESTKRSQYDLEEERRRAPKESNIYSTRREGNGYPSPRERGSNRRYWYGAHEYSYHRR